MGIFSVVDGVLDTLVAPGFSRIGYAVRSSHFTSLNTYSLRGKTVVITGPTSGLGEAVSQQVAAMGARLILVARSPEKLENTVVALKQKFPEVEISSVIADMSDLDSVRTASAAIASECSTIHAIVHNAGALLKSREVSKQNIEMTIACHVLGPHLMTTLLIPILRASHSRVITVSSGGMYASTLTNIAKGLSPEMSVEKYDGTKQYAIAKRIQVTLNEMWAEREKDISFAAMHPGWADTPGVKSSLPAFRLVTKPLLRSPEQGADTISWLVADDKWTNNSGKFWCDREIRQIHRLGSTRSSDSPETRVALWNWCNEHT